MKRPEKGRALFYTRDSGGRHEMTPGQYVEWAIRCTTELGVKFDGTAKAIDEMIRSGGAKRGDLFLDYGVQGNILSRPGLNALIDEALADPNVTHVLIPRRDRLARPDDPMDAIRLENIFRTAGISLVFIDFMLPPLPKGKSKNLAEALVAYIDYDNSEKFRRDLAQKIIPAQVALAKAGFSTGGRPSYGFERWLATEDGKPVRPLDAGEHVRMAHHHVVWLPGGEEKIAVIRRILSMIEHMPANRIAAILTAEGIPTPDAGRTRIDNGVRHATSGVWHANSITNIVRNPLIAAMMTYGRRSMGDKLRFSPDGPRDLRDSDFRDGEKAKVVQNPAQDVIVAQGHLEPLIAPDEQQRLVKILDARGGTQRGKPRSRQPDRNPLGGRVFDMNCTQPMYRSPYKDTFRYVCSAYLQTQGESCNHNTVDGPLAVRFIVSCIQQRLSGLETKLESRIRELAESEIQRHGEGGELRALENRLAKLTADLQLVTDNMALAASPEQFNAISRKFDQLTNQKKAVEAERTTARGNWRPRDVDREVSLALGLAHHLADLAQDDGNMAQVTRLLQLANARIFVRFRKEQPRKREVNRVAGGVLTFGDAPPPITIYQGPTARTKLEYVVASSTTTTDATPNEAFFVGSGSEGDSLRNTNRGDMI